MIRRSGSSSLGLLISDRGIVCAQVAANGVERVVKKIGVFTTERSILERPEETGRELKAFLASHGFTANRAVVGVPAKWTIAQERDVPPVSVAEAKGVLRLAAERLSLADSGTLVVDYAGELSPQKSKTLLVGILRSQLDKLQKMATAADLTLVGACPAALATSAFITSDHSMLYLASDGAELVQWQQGSPRSIRALSASGTDTVAVGSELKRTIAMRGGSTDGLLVCDGLGLDANATAELLSRIGTTAKSMSAESNLGVTIDSAARNGAAKNLSGSAALPAVALALGGIDRGRLPVDFTDSKLTAEKPARVSRQAWIGIGAGSLLLLVIAILFFTARSRQSEADDLNQKLKGMDKQLKDARASVAKLSYGRTYFTERPQYLECMKQLTQMFDYESPIWVETLTLKVNGEGELQGKSTDYQLNLQLADRIKKNPLFVDAKLVESQSSSGRGKEVSYTIRFTWKPAK